LESKELLINSFNAFAGVLYMPELMSAIILAETFISPFREGTHYTLREVILIYHL